MSQERDYVLGTHDDELERLGLQHRIWRGRTADAWRRAGFTVGQTLLDIGCGPGFATLDLAEIVGPAGRIHAFDRSRRFLDALDAARRARRLDQIDLHEIDLAESPLPELGADGAHGAYARWVFTFVANPRELLAKVHAALRPGGTLVLHEYFAYGTWRFAPASPDHDAFVCEVMASWRAGGGEPDIGLALPAWLVELGFAVRELRPITDVITPANYVWEWPRSFVHIGLQRLVALGRMPEERAKVIAADFEARERAEHTFMVTPSVLEIVAERR